MQICYSQITYKMAKQQCESTECKKTINNQCYVCLNKSLKPTKIKISNGYIIIPAMHRLHIQAYTDTSHPVCRFDYVI